MQPISVTVPAEQAQVIAAEVDRNTDLDGDRVAVVRVWIGPSLELVLLR